MKQKLTKLWLSAWLYVITLIAGIILGAVFVNWNVWDLQTKTFAFATALLPLHVLEEWHFPRRLPYHVQPDGKLCGC